MAAVAAAIAPLAPGETILPDGGPPPQRQGAVGLAISNRSRQKKSLASAYVYLSFDLTAVYRGSKDDGPIRRKAAEYEAAIVGLDGYLIDSIDTVIDREGTQALDATLTMSWTMRFTEAL